MKGRAMCGAAAALFALLSLVPAAFAADGPGLAASEQAAPARQEASESAAYDSVLWFRETSGGYYDEAGFSSNHYNYTQEDLMTLAKVIHLEVRGEPYEAMLAVGNVVMNRVLSPGFPGDTILDVVSRPNQFCFSPYVTPLAICVKAARDVLQNEVWVIPQDVYYFRAVHTRANWGKHRYLKHIGATAFYLDDDYPGRAIGKPVPPALFKRVYEWPQYGCEPGLRVKRLQEMLAGLGYKVRADGLYDSGTRDAVKRFQQNEGLDANGIAGPVTLDRMMEKVPGRNNLQFFGS